MHHAGSFLPVTYSHRARWFVKLSYVIPAEADILIINFNSNEIIFSPRWVGAGTPFI